MGTSTQQLGGPGNLELGELEQLTITNDNESSYDVSNFMKSFQINLYIRLRDTPPAFAPVVYITIFLCLNLSDYDTIANTKDMECKIHITEPF